MDKIKNYLLPFVDYFIAIVISILFTAFFGSWFSFRPFGIIMATALTLLMCGLIYSRSWKIAKKARLYGENISLSDGIKYVLPLVVLSVLLILIYILAQLNVIPLKSIISNTYYIFPDNLPREVVRVTGFDRYNSLIRFWFVYVLGFTKETNIFIIALTPFLIVIFAALGIKMGCKNEKILDKYISLTDKLKKKFNE